MELLDMGLLVHKIILNPVPRPSTIESSVHTSIYFYLIITDIIWNHTSTESPEPAISTVCMMYNEVRNILLYLSQISRWCLLINPTFASCQVTALRSFTTFHKHNMEWSNLSKHMFVFIVMLYCSNEFQYSSHKLKIHNSLVAVHTLQYLFRFPRPWALLMERL